MAVATATVRASSKETSNNDLSDTEHRAAENVLLSHPTEPESKTN